MLRHVRDKWELMKATRYTHLDSGGAALDALKHFSVDEVFSYKVVDRRGAALPLGPTVRLPIGGSNLGAVLGLAGLALAKNNYFVNEKMKRNSSGNFIRTVGGRN